MAPVLIDSRGLIKLGFSAVFVTAIVFAGGFFSGYQKASHFYQQDVVARPLVLPEKIAGEGSAIEPKIPDIIAAGETIDVDQAEPGSGAVELSIKTPPAIISPAEIPRGEKHVALKQAEVIGSHSVTQKNTHRKKIQKSQDALSAVSHGDTEVKKSKDHRQPDVSPSNISKARFTAQVGTFGRLPNAENMMNKLQANGMDAYITDYTAKNNTTRYNVRFGYFSDKKTALNMLKQYRSTEQADGYLVKFSARHMVDVAEVKASISGDTKKGDTPQAPSTLMPENTVENLSQLDLSEVSDSSDPVPGLN